MKICDTDYSQNRKMRHLQLLSQNLFLRYFISVLFSFFAILDKTLASTSLERIELRMMPYICCERAV